jgi:hypothetical protein
VLVDIKDVLGLFIRIELYPSEFSREVYPGLEVWLKRYNTCFTQCEALSSNSSTERERERFQTPVPRKRSSRIHTHIETKLHDPRIGSRTSPWITHFVDNFP